MTVFLIIFVAAFITITIRSAGTPLPSLLSSTQSTIYLPPSAYSNVP